MKAVLILNAGSSSLKFALFPMTPRLADTPRLSGQVEGIGAEPLMHAKDTHSGERFTEALSVPEGTEWPAPPGPGVHLRLDQPPQPGRGHRGSRPPHRARR